ncbi:MAG: phage tail assembly chaperone [Acidobacteriota bacterium]
MAEAILRNRMAPEPIPINDTPTYVQEVQAPETKGTASETMRRVRSASEDLLQELRTRWEELKERTEKQATHTSRSLRRELHQDADYVRIRARYYHENRPLQTLGVVAAAGFLLGLTLGLWRR